MRAQSGFSLVEVAVAAAIVAIVCAVVAGTLASKPGGAAAAGRAFDGA
ncbi:MAG: prepilin-type N-terminal cleavage/methylation domain-containing protein [Candidatus Eremiobacteraeota bacterium]|nr:prepilin-type N-terminal cleavage/methylation domain-containing protein [Candidatus Eremiobacteraeota bacterium]